MEKKLEFKIGLIFNGSQEEFTGFMESLKALRQHAPMIDTVPLPDHPASGLMIDTVPLPELGDDNVLFGYAQDSRKGIEGVFIGTWPTPEGVLPKDVLNKIAEGMQRVRILDDIYGGMRHAHFHLGDEIILLDRNGLKEFVGSLVKELVEQF